MNSSFEGLETRPALRLGARRIAPKNFVPPSGNGGAGPLQSSDPGLARSLEIQVDPQDGMIRVDGIIIGRKVMRDGRVCIQVCDKDKRRAAERGTRFPEFSVADLVRALSGKDPG